MSGRVGWVTAVEVLVGVAVVLVVVGGAIGQPILLSYVTSGSMAPTVQAGDGFVAIPDEVAGEIETGDVVTFRAEELHGGGLTTHRVVGETERGFVTKGDANPFTDQDGSEPPVKRSQVVAVAWQPGGEVLALPKLGVLVTGTSDLLTAVQTTLAGAFGSRSLLGTQGIAYLVLGATALLYALDVLFGSTGGRDRTRERERDSGVDPRLVAAGFAAVVVVAATAAMVVPAGTQKFGIVSAESDAPGQRIIETGTSESFDYPIQNGGVVPVVSYLEPASEGVAVEGGERYVPGRTIVNATVTLSAPPETGYYRRFVTEHRYLALLPTGVIRSLHGTHPWLPILAIDGLLGGLFYVGTTAALGRGRVRRVSRESVAGGPLGRLRRWVS